MITVYFNAGEALTPWHVGFHDGVSVTAIYELFKHRDNAIIFASVLAGRVGVPVKLPEWVKG